MIIVNNLCDFLDLYTSLSVMFVCFLTGEIQTFIIIIMFIECLPTDWEVHMLVECLETQGLACSLGVYHPMGRHVDEVSNMNLTG